MSLQSYLHDLADPGQPLRAADLAKLSNLSPQNTPALEETWAALSGDRKERIIKALIDLAEDNVELNFDALFMVALADQDATVRREAIQGLWEYHGPGLVDALLRALEQDEDARVRAESAIALGRYALKNELDGLRSSDGDRVDRALRHAFEDEREPVEVRGRALESLGARSEPWVRSLVEQAYESEERRLRTSAVHAMGRSADVSWLPALAAEAENEEPEMRFEVATAAGAIGDEAATPLLIELSRDEDEEVREAAIGALGEIGGETARKALRDLLDEPSERLREAALEALREAEFADDPLGVRVID